MSQSTLSAPAVTTETVTLTFNNRMPLRVRQPVNAVWLGHAYLDFGGRRVRYCRRSAGGIHVWYCYGSPYSDDRSYDSYLGHGADAEAISALLEASDELDYEDAGAVLIDMQDEGYITLPVE